MPAVAGQDLAIVANAPSAELCGVAIEDLAPAGIPDPAVLDDVAAVERSVVEACHNQKPPSARQLVRDLGKVAQDRREISGAIQAPRSDFAGPIAENTR